MRESRLPNTFFRSCAPHAHYNCQGGPWDDVGWYEKNLWTQINMTLVLHAGKYCFIRWKWISQVGGAGWFCGEYLRRSIDPSIIPRGLSFLLDEYSTSLLAFWPWNLVHYVPTYLHRPNSYIPPHLKALHSFLYRPEEGKTKSSLWTIIWNKPNFFALSHAPQPWTTLQIHK